MTVGKIGGSQSAKGFMPTKEQIKSAYGSACHNAVKNGTAKALKTAPKNFAKYPSYNITPKGELGVDQKAYCIKGHLYMASTAVAPNAKTHWMDCGMAPVF